MRLLREPVTLLLFSALILWGVHTSFGPPKVLPDLGQTTEFSGSRALLILRDLWQEQQPHPAGSAANALVRDRIVEFLQSAGYEPEIQRRFHCNPASGDCATVENIIAVRQGNPGDRAVLLTAHYDSVWAGPGVADDGSGVAAVLEIARLFRQRPAASYDLVLLLTDGEEAGLIGAHAFAAQHPLFKDVRVVLNLEARGVGGGSAMFETGEGNRSLIRVLAQSLDRPLANSLTYEIYRRMPNDTDFTVYRERGAAGLNFAFIRGAGAYHTPLDNLERIDAGSLQHHGQNAWSLLQGLDGRNLDRLRSDEDAAYIDLFARFLLQYPASSALGLALVLGILTIAIVPRVFPRQISLRQVAFTLLGIVVLAVLLALVGLALSWPLGTLPQIHPLDHPFPWFGWLALVLGAAFVVLHVLRFISPRASAGSVMFTCWLGFAVLAGLLAYLVPAASFIAVLPLLFYLVGMLLDGLRWKKPPRLLFAGTLGFLAAAYLGFYFFQMVGVIVSFDRSELLMLPLLLPAVASLPQLVWYVDERRPGIAASVVLLVLIGGLCTAHQFVPGFTARVPVPANLVYHENDEAAWLYWETAADGLAGAVARRQGFESTPLRTIAGESATGQVLARKTISLRLPDIAVATVRRQTSEEFAGQTLDAVTLEIPAGVRELSLRLPSGQSITRARINGVWAVAPGARSAKSREITELSVTHPEAGILRLELFSGSKRPGALEVLARYELPEYVLAPFSVDWPDEIQPLQLGHRAEQVLRVDLEP